MVGDGSGAPELCGTDRRGQGSDEVLAWTRHCERSAAKPDREERDHGGHFVAREFGGPEIALNHFAQDGRINKGEFRKVELIWKANLTRKRRVFVSIRPHYVEASKRPVSLDVTFFVDGVRYYEDVPNRSKGK